MSLKKRPGQLASKERKNGIQGKNITTGEQRSEAEKPNQSTAKDCMNICSLDPFLVSKEWSNVVIIRLTPPYQTGAYSAFHSCQSVSKSKWIPVVKHV
jgi:hypothetical protein